MNLRPRGAALIVTEPHVIICAISYVPPLIPALVSLPEALLRREALEFFSLCSTSSPTVRDRTRPTRLYVSCGRPGSAARRGSCGRPPRRGTPEFWRPCGGNICRATAPHFHNPSTASTTSARPLHCRRCGRHGHCRSMPTSAKNQRAA